MIVEIPNKKEEFMKTEKEMKKELKLLKENLRVQNLILKAYWAVTVQYEDFILDAGGVVVNMDQYVRAIIESKDNRACIMPFIYEI